MHDTPDYDSAFFEMLEFVNYNYTGQNDDQKKTEYERKKNEKRHS